MGIPLAGSGQGAFQGSLCIALISSLGPMPGEGPTLTIGEPGGLKLGHAAMPARNGAGALLTSQVLCRVPVRQVCGEYRLVEVVPKPKAAGGSIQNQVSRLLISQHFLPRSGTNRHFRRTLRNKRFSRASGTTAQTNARVRLACGPLA